MLSTSVKLGYVYISSRNWKMTLTPCVTVIVVRPSTEDAIDRLHKRKPPRTPKDLPGPWTNRLKPYTTLRLLRVSSHDFGG